MPFKDKEALIVTFWRSFEEHEQSHRSDTFQPLFKQVLELCENGNEEIAYSMLWSGQGLRARGGPGRARSQGQVRKQGGINRKQSPRCTRQPRHRGVVVLGNSVRFPVHFTSLN